MGNVGMDSSKKPPEMNIFCRNDGTSQRVKQTTPLSTTLSHLHVGSLTQPLTRHVHSLVTAIDCNEYPSHHHSFGTLQQSYNHP